ncbi:hypothetical protein BDV93DRAFT_79903 [Ceratobasidium sp. AG-I]|nr:hypothetical protein BDV93DRAFT_79903 [Ceratobasidium sp. AG-I]
MDFDQVWIKHSKSWRHSARVVKPTLDGNPFGQAFVYSTTTFMAFYVFSTAIQRSMICRHEPSTLVAFHPLPPTPHCRDLRAGATGRLQYQISSLFDIDGRVQASSYFTLSRLDLSIRRVRSLL